MLGRAGGTRAAIKLRWATYWPVPYWNVRFNELASRPEIDLDVVYLSSRSSMLCLPSTDDQRNFRFHVVRDERSNSGYKSFVFRWPRPWRLVRGTFDYLVMPYGDPDYVAAAFLCRALGKSYILFVASTDFDSRPESTLRRELKKRLHRWARACFVTGNSQYRHARACSGFGQMVERIGNPAPPLAGLSDLVASGSRQEIRRQLGWSGEFVILFVGRLAPEKGLHELLAALRDRRFDAESTRLVLVGSGPLRVELERTAESLGLPVEFKGTVTGGKLTELYYCADAFVLPSVSEPWGLVVNEAMEAGLPVVISDRVGARESLVSDGNNGLVYASGDACSLADKLVLLAGDKRLRASLAEAGRKVIQGQSVEKWADSVVAALIGLQARSGG